MPNLARLSDRHQTSACNNTGPKLRSITQCRKVNIISPKRLQITDTIRISSYTLHHSVTFLVVTKTKSLTGFYHHWARHFRFRIKS